VFHLADRRKPVNTARGDEYQRSTRLRVLALLTDAESARDRDWPGHSRVKFLRAADAFDRRDHVMSAAAYQLHAKATLSSAADDHPGFVPDEYVTELTGEDLHCSDADPALMATELCSDGMWRRTDAGYRVLDWLAVQAAIEHVRELRAVDKPARNPRSRPATPGSGPATSSGPRPRREGSPG
jgi:hypothetical protein